MYIIFEYFALLALVAITATVAFGVASVILVIDEAAKWSAAAFRRLFVREGSISFSPWQSEFKAEVFGQAARHAAPRWHKSSVEPMSVIARPAA